MNGRGLWTLFAKEIRRFSSVWIQTVLSPLVTTTLYFLVFGVALGSHLETTAGAPYGQFVVPGLVLLAVIQAAYANTSSSFLQAKMNGTIQDVLAAPLSALEILIAYVLAATVRALVVGSLVWVVAAVLGQARAERPVLAVAITIVVAVTSASLGLLAAVRAERFEQVSAIPSFVLTPLVFLGGVFYAVGSLPSPWAQISRANPIFYAVDGLRRALVGVGEADPTLTGLVIVGLVVLSTGATYGALARSRRLVP